MGTRAPPCKGERSRTATRATARDVHAYAHDRSEEDLGTSNLNRLSVDVTYVMLGGVYGALGNVT